MLSLSSREHTALVLYRLDIVEVTSGAVCFRKSTFDGERSVSIQLLLPCCLYGGSFFSSFILLDEEKSV